MKILAVVTPGQAHHSTAASRLAVGLARHGLRCEIDIWRGLVGRGLAVRGARADAYVCWGWRKGKALRQATRRPVLVMERGYIGDRFRWTSLGWNGLNGRAQWNAEEDPARLHALFPGLLAPAWKTDRRDASGAGLAVIMGQVQGDMALEACTSFPLWVAQATRAAERLGLTPRFRAHPVSLQKGQTLALPARLARIGGDLAEVLAQAALVLTWNSNSGVDAALAGVPTIACDPGSMALDVAARGLQADPFAALCDAPARERWAARLAWRQWSDEEIASGEAWAHVGKVGLDGALSTDAARA